MFQAHTALTLPPLNGAAPRDRAIVATLLYYDIFSFPLRADELARFAHCAEPFDCADLTRHNAWWNSRDAFWFLQGREEFVQRRAHLQAASVEKLERARKYARLLQLIPGVRFIGVTGSLAMASAVPEDDIDFLIITQKNRLWFTRALVLSALLAWGVKRPDDGKTEYPNLICANIFLSQDDLRMPDEIYLSRTRFVKCCRSWAQVHIARFSTRTRGRKIICRSGSPRMFCWKTM